MEDNSIKITTTPKEKFNVLDTSYFIKLTPLNMSNGWKYYTTEFIIKEIRDEKVSKKNLKKLKKGQKFL